MTYVEAEHKYRLTKEYVLHETGIDLRLLVNSPYIVDKTTAVNRILMDLSDQVYAFIYSHNMRYQKYVEYLMAKSPMARENIRVALLKQLSYTVRNGKLDEFAGVNVSYNAKNAVTPLEDTRGDRSIHPEAIVALSIPLEDGEKLIYTGNYNIPTNFDAFYRVGY